VPHETAPEHVVVGLVPGSAQYCESCCAAAAQLVHPAHGKSCPSLVLYAIDAHAPFEAFVVHSW
jgi:hypothetical protein